MKKPFAIVFQITLLFLLLLSDRGVQANQVHLAPNHIKVFNRYDAHLQKFLSNNYVHTGQRAKTKPIATRIKASREKTIFVVKVPYHIPLLGIVSVASADSYYRPFILSAVIVCTSERAPPQRPEIA